MPFYEITLIVRQDIAQSDVDKIVEQSVNVIKEHKGTIIKKEYWGLLTMAYMIKKNRKGHYTMLGVEANGDAVKELERQLRLNEDVLRYLTVRVEEMTKEPSMMMKYKNQSVSAES